MRASVAVGDFAPSAVLAFRSCVTCLECIRCRKWKRLSLGSTTGPADSPNFSIPVSHQYVN